MSDGAATPSGPMNVTEHHAAGRDGTRLYWTSTGAGAPAVVLLDGVGCAGYVWRHLAPALAAERRVIHWNYRAHGRSDAPVDPFRLTLDDCVDDLLSVLDAAGEAGAVLAGHSMGVQVAVEAHRRAPGRVRGLVLLCGAPGRVIDSFHDSPALRMAFPFARAIVDRYPSAVRSAFRAVLGTELAIEYALAFEVDRKRIDRADLVRYFEDLAAIDPTLFVRLLSSAAAHDGSDHLPQIDVPTLVVAGERDNFTPMRLSLRLHEAIPGSDLLVVPGGTHVAPLEDPDRIMARLSAFLRDRVGGAAPRRRAAKPKATPTRRRARRPTGNT
jgi:pimeloyl-ACP methyl ester carboxylesterase